MFRPFLAFTFLFLAASCSGGDGDGSANSDPRCNSICVIEEPSLEGAHDICSEESAVLCRDECNARIELTENLCATCLLEGAEFGLGDGDVGIGDFCENGQCTKRGREGSCTYPEGDDQARDDCTRQVYPRREVHCDSEFASVQNCSGICES
jgi:hypothetical protein